MGDIAHIIRTNDGFSIATNTSSANLAAKTPEMVHLPKQNSTLVFHDDVPLAHDIFKEVEKQLVVNDGIYEVFTKLSAYIMANHNDKSVAYIGCGFFGDQAVMLGISRTAGYIVRPFYGFLPASGEPTHLMLNDILKPNTRTAAEAHLYSALFFSKLSSTNHQLHFNFQFATHTYQGFKILPQNKVIEILKKANDYHNSIRTKLSTLFLEV